jgi:WD40 repeat protein
MNLPRFAPRLQAVAVSPGGETFATATDDRVVRVWDAETGAERSAWPGHAGQSTALAYAPDGRTLASAGRDGELKLWDVATGKERVAVEPFKQRLGDVAYAPDGRHLAVAVDDGTARVVDAQTGKVLRTFVHPASVRRVAFTPDGRWLAVTFGDEGQVRVYEVDGGRQRSAFQAAGGGPVYDLQFSRDGKRLLAASGDDVATTWDLSEPEARVVAALKGHQGKVWFAVWVPDGPNDWTIATGGEDKTIRLWTVRRRE